MNPADPALSGVGVTVTVLVVLTNPEVAVTTTVPLRFAVASPPGPKDRMEGSLELQLIGTDEVLPSELMPDAVNFTVEPTGTGGRLAGEIARPCSTGAPMLSVTGGEVVAPMLALIAAVP